ncbi:unnamed protein product [Heligmosomoides polygyrus]|uniref:DUF4283 domain-containing protein n=1 Tax=Heligmosomoides polygyrus TaxID=6339 RepID=A0A183GUB5_HELPZ|nr:unnamed protein product [Heligmosomoides polygyrus]
MNLQLLKRPQPLPRFQDEENGVHAQWGIKVDVGYVEDVNDILDVRGCNFRLLLFGIDNIVVRCYWLRFLIVRQRVPHSITGKPFEWQVQPIKNDRPLKISKFSPLNCFRFC